MLWCMGEAHADVLLDRLSKRHGVEVEKVDLRVPLRETFGGKCQAMGRNVKQTGGHGQYAICHLEVEPLPSGGVSSSWTRSSAVWCRASSSRRWRRAYGPRWGAAWSPDTRWSTSA
nr:hypothetical protein GCM10020093_031060 [Planobispora longispora]